MKHQIIFPPDYLWLAYIPGTRLSSQTLLAVQARRPEGSWIQTGHETNQIMSLICTLYFHSCENTVVNNSTLSRMLFRGVVLLQ